MQFRIFVSNSSVVYSVGLFYCPLSIQNYSRRAKSVNSYFSISHQIFLTIRRSGATTLNRVGGGSPNERDGGRPPDEGNHVPDILRHLCLFFSVHSSQKVTWSRWQCFPDWRQLVGTPRSIEITNDYFPIFSLVFITNIWNEDGHAGS